MKKFLLTLIVSIAFCGSIFAQGGVYSNPNGYESHWADAQFNWFEDVDYPCFFVKIDNNIVTFEDRWYDYEFASFVGDECRGHDFMTSEYLEYGWAYPLLEGLMVKFTTPGEELTFKMYDHATGIEYDYGVSYPEIHTGETHIENWFLWPEDFEQEGWEENALFLLFTSPDTPQPTSYQLHIDGYEDNGGYYLIASPINEETTPTDGNGFLTDAYDLYYFDQEQDFEWRNYEANAFNVVAGKGYLYASATETDLTFTGTLYDGEGTFPLVYNGEMDWAGYNLVGNPFFEAAYVSRDYYVMNADGSDVMTEPASGTIAPMTGCFVVAEGEDENVTFSLEEPETRSSLVAINLCNNRGVIDRAIVRFGEGRQLPKFQLNRNNTKVYIPVDTIDYAIVRSEGIGEMPVNFKANENGVYSLNVTSENVGFNYLHLIDNLTGADVDLLANPSYSFEAKTTDYASRFRLVFATGNADDTFAFFSNGNFVISNDGEATVQVVDVNGRIMSSQSINGSASINVDGAAGVYMIRLINGDNVKVQKVIVK